MGRYDNSNVEAIQTRTMTMFYLFDVSGSMAGTKIEQVNFAMRDIPKIIKDVSDGAPNAQIEIAAATFANTVEWITPKPQTPDDFITTWKPVCAEGLTSLGAALNSLNEKMSRKAFLSENPLGYYAPGVIILSDGAPTDEWQKALAELNKNNWFKSATKVAFAVGEDADFDVLAQICGTKEAVISIDDNDPDKIRQYIQFVTATVSKTGTMSNLDEDAQTAVNKAIADIDNDMPIVVDIPDIDDEQWD
ncbi:MAG: hypothetical protein IJV77_05135 [Clostridia bacterium]|nr:hypothetical protein [Clostridia bacterium]